MNPARRLAGINRPRNERRPSTSAPNAGSQASTRAAQTKADDAPVTDCDKYAANSLDPDRKAPGVNFPENAALAMPACEAAVQQYPDSARFMQLGRAHHKKDGISHRRASGTDGDGHGSVFGEAALGLMRAGKACARAIAVPLIRDPRKGNGTGAMGFLYASGEGVAKDTEQSLVWYRRAAEQGAPNAQLNLGIAYEERQRRAGTSRKRRCGDPRPPPSASRTPRSGWPPSKQTKSGERRK